MELNNWDKIIDDDEQVARLTLLRTLEKIEIKTEAEYLYVKKICKELMTELNAFDKKWISPLKKELLWLKDLLRLKDRIISTYRKETIGRVKLLKTKIESSGIMLGLIEEKINDDSEKINDDSEKIIAHIQIENKDGTVSTIDGEWYYSIGNGVANFTLKK